MAERLFLTFMVTREGEKGHAMDHVLTGVDTNEDGSKAFYGEQERRFWAETPEIWLGGPEGEQALIADVFGDEERRRIEHRDACWAGCDDLHDDPCEYCELPDCLGDCWGEEYEDDDPTPRVVTEHAFADRGLL